MTSTYSAPFWEQASESLVQQLKDMQRRDPVAKDQWIAYTDAHGQGRRDPNKHSAQFIHAFIQMFNSGTRLSLHEDAYSVVDLTKNMLKRSQAFQNVWDKFCHAFGNGVTDPLKHEPAFHVKFFDHIAEKANTMEGAAGYEWGSAKRPRRDEGAPSGDLTKDKLVLAIKKFQRQSEPNREKWRNYCDENLGGRHDPARHEASDLQYFIAMHGVPEVEAGPFDNQPRGGVGYYLDTDPMDAEKYPLVKRVSEFLNLGQDQKEAWHSFLQEKVGGKMGRERNPVRHKTARLEEFCSLHGI